MVKPFKGPPPVHDGLREQYRPPSITVLFVGESPPDGPTFFYRANSRLFSAMKEGFQQAYQVAFPTNDSFLRAFQASGCFLDDLCDAPVNHMPRGPRRQARRGAEGGLADRIVAARPRIVIPVAKSIDRYVVRAVQASGLDVHVLPATPFPAFGHTPASIRSLAKHVGYLRGEGILPSVLP